MKTKLNWVKIKICCLQKHKLKLNLLIVLEYSVVYKLQNNRLVTLVANKT